MLAILIRGEGRPGEQLLAELVDTLLQVEGSNQRKLITVGTLLATVMVDRKGIAEQARLELEWVREIGEKQRIGNKFTLKGQNSKIYS